MLAAYRRTGADLPFGDLRAPHGVAMEGWFWRMTDAAAGVALVVFVAINRPPRGAQWATVGLAGHPGGFSRAAAVHGAVTAGPGMRLLAVEDGRAVLRAHERALEVDLGPGARLRATLAGALEWPRRAFGGIGPAQVLPGLSQYWHPWLLHARATGTAELGDRAVRLDGARAYAEKSWGAGGFPARWWWGQAHDFADRGDVCVAFAGGDAHAAGVPVTATSIVVRAGDEIVRVTRPPAPLRVAAGGGAWRLAGRTARHAIVLEGHADGNAPHLLPVPVPAEHRNAEAVAAQHLAGELRVTLRRGRRTVYAGSSPLAGLEEGGGGSAGEGGPSPEGGPPGRGA
jgi:hypothetical protein